MTISCHANNNHFHLLFREATLQGVRNTVIYMYKDKFCWSNEFVILESHLRYITSLVLKCCLFLVPVMSSLLLSMTVVQIDSYYLLTMYECHDCTFMDTLWCWLLLWFIGVRAGAGTVTYFPPLASCIVFSGTRKAKLLEEFFHVTSIPNLLSPVSEINGVFFKRGLSLTTEWQPISATITFRVTWATTQTEVSHAWYFCCCYIFRQPNVLGEGHS